MSFLRQLLEAAMEQIEGLPCGGIGENGAPLDLLAAAERAGCVLYGDAMAHNGQRAWLHLREALSQIEPKGCRWQEDGGTSWETGCGHSFTLNDGTPKENDMKYCCYCGGALVEVVPEPSEEEMKA